MINGKTIPDYASHFRCKLLADHITQQLGRVEYQSIKRFF